MINAMMQFRAWLLGLILIGVAGLLWFTYFSSAEKWPLEKVEIQGDFTNLNAVELKRQVRQAIDGGFFTVDMAAIRQDLLAFQWVEEVTIRKIWPHTLRVRVTEQKPVARWLTADGQVVLANRFGDIFHTPVNAATQHLPLLQGEASKAADMVNFYVQIQARARQNKLHITTVQLNTRQEWRVQFNNGLQLILGQTNHKTRWRDFIQLYPQIIAYGEPLRIDMRYAHGMAVRWSSSESANQASIAPQQFQSNG